MQLILSQLGDRHPLLRRHPVNYARSGALALHRAGHRSPTTLRILEDAAERSAQLAWQSVGSSDLLLPATDEKRITEDGAEAIALAYVNETEAWVVKRRGQQGESAD